MWYDLEQMEDHRFLITKPEADHIVVVSSHPLSERDVHDQFLCYGKVTKIEPKPSTIGYAYRVWVTPWVTTCTQGSRSSGET